MLGLLIKKQLAEIFRAYLYNPKKNKARSKISIALWFAFFILVMVGLLGGMFSYLAWTLRPVIRIGLGWFYFSLLSGLAAFLGIFGSVFNTNAGLYLAKDNDLLLSMPIPVNDIIIARLASVYLMGLMYSSTVAVPAIVVYFMTDKVTPAKILGSVLWMLTISMIVFAMSCLLGYLVALATTKLKQKKITTVLLSVIFIIVYYVCYFRASDILRDLLKNAQLYGEKVKGAAYPLYLFGAMGTGDGIGMLVYTVVTVLLLAAVWTVLSRSFLKIVASTGKTGHVVYREKAVKRKSIFGAVLGKELGRFTGSASYMLNCGLGILLLPLAGGLFIFKGQEMVSLITMMFAGMKGMVAFSVIAIICMCASMNDMVTPSISLEGKNIWILQSLPVSEISIFRAKIMVQILLTEIPALVPMICACVVFDFTLPEMMLVFLVPTLYICLLACFGLFIGLQRPNLKWTSEIYPIKQSMSVMISLFGGMLYLTAGVLAYVFLNDFMDVYAYLGLFATVTFLLILLLLLWLHKGAAKLWVRIG